jgi:hypothetical protein
VVVAVVSCWFIAVFRSRNGNWSAGVGFERERSALLISALHVVTNLG